MLHTVIFDKRSPCWKGNPEYNKMFINCQRRYASDLLRARGHLVLNEVYDMLGIPRTIYAMTEGWVDIPDKKGDHPIVSFECEKTLDDGRIKITFKTMGDIRQKLRKYYNWTE